jgi:hypothetical protein
MSSYVAEGAGHFGGVYEDVEGMRMLDAYICVAVEQVVRYLGVLAEEAKPRLVFDMCKGWLGLWNLRM